MCFCWQEIGQFNFALNSFVLTYGGDEDDVVDTIEDSSVLEKVLPTIYDGGDDDDNAVDDNREGEDR